MKSLLSSLLFLAALLFVALSTPACDDTSPSDACTAIDCGAHGRCGLVEGAPACLCDPNFVREGLNCVDDPCLSSPCVQGTCRADGRAPVCDCQPGFTGAFCERCAPGYRAEGLRCVLALPCSEDPCVYGVCAMVDGAPSCACLPNFAGALCDTCAPGYVAKDLDCVSATPCAPDPCGHGACDEATGEAVCACEAGYGGATCEECAVGFHVEGLGCVPDVSSPCDPNPCADAERRVCQVVGETFSCGCNPGTHDEAGVCVADQTQPCLPNPCVEAHEHVCSVVNDAAVCSCDAGFHAEAGSCVADSVCVAATTCSGHGACSGQGVTCVCDEGYGGAHCETCQVGYRAEAGGCVLDVSCDTVMSYVPGPGESITALYVRGEFNGWGLSTPLALGSDGVYRVALQLDPGSYAYKLYEQGADRWFEDPNNAFFKWDGGVRNSRLRVRDCDQPKLLLTAAPQVSAAGDVSFAVRFVPGASGAALDPATVVATQNRVDLAQSFVSGTLTVADTALAKGKHTYRFAAADSAGRAAELLYVPLWVEDAPFDWRDAVMYFVLTDRFADGDASNNSPVVGVDPKANWHGGDFAGLQAQVEAGYFDDLGVNTLWISSISQNTTGSGAGSDGRQYSAYHSYWPISTGWRDDAPLAGVSPVDLHFGTADELHDLIDAAHRRGVRVLSDFVANHVHTDSPLWAAHQNDSPAWFHALYVCGWDQPISCWFASYLPDFDYTNQQVFDTSIEHAIWMIQEFDLDGFRLDAVKHMVHDFSFGLRGRIAESVATTGLRFYMVGETFTGEDGAPAIKEYVRPQELDGQFDFPLFWQVLATFLREERDFRSVEAMLRWNEVYYGPWAVMSNFLGNHDVARALSHANGDIADMWGNGAKEQGWLNPPALPTSSLPFKRLRMAWTFLMTLPGVPLIYYGDELGMQGAGDPDNRLPMLFGASLSLEQQATLEHVRALGLVRQAHDALRRGVRQQLQMDADGLFWAYSLKDGGDVCVVAFNRTASVQTRSVSMSALGVADGVVFEEALGGATSTVAGGMLELGLGSRESGVWVLR